MLDAAAEVFSRRGYRGATLLDIGERAGMKPGSLYYHFTSKEALVAELLETAVRRAQHAVADALDSLDEPAGARLRLRTALWTYLEEALTEGSYGAAYVRMIGQVPESVRASVRANERKLGQSIVGLLHDARDAGEIRRDIDIPTIWLLIVGAANWSVEWPPHRRRDHRLIHESFDKLIFGGLDR